MPCRAVRVRRGTSPRPPSRPACRVFPNRRRRAQRSRCAKAGPARSSPMSRSGDPQCPCPERFHPDSDGERVDVRKSEAWELETTLLYQRTARKGTPRATIPVLELRAPAAGFCLVLAPADPLSPNARLDGSWREQPIWSAAGVGPGWMRVQLQTDAPAAVPCWCATISKPYGTAGRGGKWPTGLPTCGVTLPCCRLRKLRSSV